MRHELKLVKLDENNQRRSINKLQREYNIDHNLTSRFHVVPKSQDLLPPYFTCQKSCKSIEGKIEIRRNLTRLTRGLPKVKLHVFGNNSAQTNSSKHSRRTSEQNHLLIKKAKSWVETFGITVVWITKI